METRIGSKSTSRRIGDVDIKGVKRAWESLIYWRSICNDSFAHEQRNTWQICCVCVMYTVCYVNQDTRNLQRTRGLSGWVVLVSLLHKTKVVKLYSTPQYEHWFDQFSFCQKYKKTEYSVGKWWRFPLQNSQIYGLSLTFESVMHS